MCKNADLQQSGWLARLLAGRRKNTLLIFFFFDRVCVLRVKKTWHLESSIYSNSFKEKKKKENNKVIFFFADPIEEEEEGDKLQDFVFVPPPPLSIDCAVQHPQSSRIRNRLEGTWQTVNDLLLLFSYNSAETGGWQKEGSLLQLLLMTCSALLVVGAVLYREDTEFD